MVNSIILSFLNKYFTFCFLLVMENKDLVTTTIVNYKWGREYISIYIGQHLRLFWGFRLTLPAEGWFPLLYELSFLRSSSASFISRATLCCGYIRCYSTEVLCEVSNQITWMFQWNIFGYLYEAEYLCRIASDYLASFQHLSLSNLMESRNLP